MNPIGIAIFITVAFVPVYAFDAYLLATDPIAYEQGGLWSPIIFTAMLLIPGAAAWIASRVTGEWPKDAPVVRPIPIAPLIVAIVAMPLFAAALHLVEVAVGYGRINWELEALQNQFTELGWFDEAEGLPLPPIFLLVLGIFVDVFRAVVIVGLAALASEIGWRGYLLPQLLKPLGRIRAFIAIGVLQGLWFAPLFFVHTLRLSDPLSSAVRCVAVAAVFGVILGEIVRRTRSLVVSAVVCGGFIAHFSGSLDYFFYAHEIPFTGPIGIMALAGWIMVASVLYCWPEKTVSTPKTQRVAASRA